MRAEGASGVAPPGMESHPPPDPGCSFHQLLCVALEPGGVLTSPAKPAPGTAFSAEEEESRPPEVLSFFGYCGKTAAQKEAAVGLTASPRAGCPAPRHRRGD